MRYMLDTNVCVELIRKKSARLLDGISRLPVGEVGVSAITVSELQHGVQKSRDPQQNLEGLEQFLSSLVIADFDYAASFAYGQIRAHLERAGTPIGSMDLLIAAHALSLNATLVTNNTREFTRVPNLVGEDWLT